ncbi:hypothetical protein [Flavobacterium rhizosphaerae]|uniref:Uncharacterized protein n=1 Tax=Flavobacterium rhizosphaerae TaxID=3163298 RepID=A0ABW8YZK3_9FLAO
MKKLFCFLAVAGTALFTSCSNDDDSGSNKETAIVLTADAQTVTVGETFTFTVKNNLDENVTSDATIYVNNVAQSGNTFEATQVGSFTVHATKDDLTSNDITVVVAANPATSVSVAVSATEVNVGDEVTFTATTNTSVDVTEDAVFYVNDVAIEGNAFTPDASGSYSVHAVYQELTSEDVMFTATLEGTNIALLNGTEYTTDKSTLYYLGSDLEAGLSYWVANPYNQVGEGDDASYPNDVYIYFTTAQLSESLDLPTTGSYTFGDDATVNSIFNVEVYLDSNTYADDTEVATDASMNISAFEAGNTVESQTWTYDYTITLANGDVVSGNYDGQWGFYDTTTGRFAARTTNNAAVKNATQAQIAQAKAQVLAKRNK